MKNEFSNAKSASAQTSTCTKTHSVSKLLFAILLSVVLFGGALFLLFANHSAPVSTALAANSLETLPTTLDTAPTFTYDSSASTITGTDQTINGYNFKDDVYKAFTRTNRKIGDVTYPYVVTLTKYTPTTPTQVVVPSQIKIDGNTYQVVIDCSNCYYTDPFFANKDAVTNIALASVGGTKVLAINCRYMFYNCSKPTSLDLSNFDTSNVIIMYDMFNSCSNLTTILLPKVYSEIFDAILPATFYLESNNSVVGETLNSFSDYASTESTKSKIVKGNYIFEIVVQSEYGTISDGTKNSVERLAYMYSNSATYSITDNTISFGTVTITATPNGNCTFSGFFNSDTDTTQLSGEKSIKANTTIYARFASSQSIAPQFSISSYLTLTGVDSAYTLPDGSTYDFTKDKYTFSFRNTVIGSSTTAKDYVFIEKYNSTGTTKVVIPSQMIIGGINYQVVIDCSDCYSGSPFFGNRSVVTDISFASVGETKVLATEYYCMFYNCSGLTSLDLSSFNTSKVTGMSCMFYNCSGLTSLDISNFDTSNVTYMYEMFSGCSGLTSLNLSNFDTSNVTDIRSMFENCSSLTSLDLSSFDTSNVTNMSLMFKGCSNLTSLDLSSFNTSNVINMSEMFKSCSKLASLDISNFYMTKITSKSHRQDMFYSCASLATLKCTNMKLPADSSSLFSGLYALKTLDLSNADSSNVTNMSSMFYYCPKLTSLDLSSFDTSNVTDMRSMFATGVWNSEKQIYESALSKIVFGENFNTSKVTNMSSMFEYCSSLTSLDLSSFNTSNVTGMSNMFEDCRSLTSLDLSNFNTSNLTSMSGMFSGCSSLTSAGVNTAEKTYDLNFGPNFDTSNVTNMYNMFRNCSSLTSLDLNNFNTSNVTDMSKMFSNCSSLTSAGVNTAEKTYALNFGPKFNTSNVTDMNCMFYNCSSLISLDLSNFDTRNVYDMTQMFNRCTSLTSLTLGEYFDMSQVEYISMAFATGSTLDVLDLSKITFNNNIATDFYNTFAIFGINKEYLRSVAEENENGSGDTYAKLIYPEGQEPNAEKLADYMYDYVSYYCSNEELIDSAKAVLNTKIGKIILPASVNGLLIALPTGNYAVNGANKYSSPYLLGYKDLKTADGTSYPAGATLQIKALAPETPTETGVETSLLFAVSGAVVVALFAVAVAHVGKKKRVVKK